MHVESLSSMTCSICGRRKATHKLKVSEKFTAYPDLYAGTAVCDVCGRLIEDQRYRRSHWILIGDDVKLLGKEELLKVLENPPPGSLIYVKSSGRRYGFLRALRFTSSGTMVALCGEDEGVVFIPRDRLSYLVKLAEDAYNTLKRKTPLLEGCSAGEWMHEGLCKEIEQVKGELAWRIVVRAL
jgi:hypothetical protein